MRSKSFKETRAYDDADELNTARKRLINLKR